MSREVSFSSKLRTRIVEWDIDEVTEVLELIEALREVPDLNNLIDDTVVYPPIVVHYTTGQYVGVSWRTTPAGVAITNIDRYRPPPPDMP